MQSSSGNRNEVSGPPNLKDPGLESWALVIAAADGCPVAGAWRFPAQYCAGKRKHESAGSNTMVPLAPPEGRRKSPRGSSVLRFPSDLCWGLLWAERPQPLGSPVLAGTESWRHTQLPLARKPVFLCLPGSHCMAWLIINKLGFFSFRLNLLSLD